LDEEITQQRLPGAVALVARRGKIAYRACLGARDPAAQTAMTEDTIFRLYSMSKPIIAVAAMMLVEQGRMLLSDPVARYIPEFARSTVAIERKDAATGAIAVDLVPALRPLIIHDLLRQTAGYTYEHLAKGPLQAFYREAGTARRDQSVAELARRLATVPLAFQPGTRWRSGHATDILGRVIEVVSGVALGEALARMVLRPLGMADTGFSVPSAQHHRIAEPFAQDPESGAPVSLFRVTAPPQLESGGGGLVSTLADYTRFLTMLTSGGRCGETQLLSRKTIQYMTSDHIGDLPSELPGGYGYGLGFGVRRAPGIAATIGSRGEYYWSGVVGTGFFVDPQEQLFAVFLSQAPGQRERLNILFRNLVSGALVD
jgi:CubicO group peptidase (beta-lactamase class C family)